MVGILGRGAKGFVGSGVEGIGGVAVKHLRRGRGWQPRRIKASAAVAES